MDRLHAQNSREREIRPAEWSHFNSEICIMNFKLLSPGCDFSSVQLYLFFLLFFSPFPLSLAAGCSALIAGLQSERTELWCFYQLTDKWMNSQLSLRASETSSSSSSSCSSSSSLSLCLAPSYRLPLTLPALILTLSPLRCVSSPLSSPLSSPSRVSGAVRHFGVGTDASLITVESVALFRDQRLNSVWISQWILFSNQAFYLPK